MLPDSLGHRLASLHRLVRRLFGRPHAHSRRPSPSLRLETLEARVVPTAGTLDDSFGLFGQISQSQGGFDEGATAVAQQKNGKIVAVGYTQRGSATSTNYDFTVARYNADGTADQTFGSLGKRRIAFNKGGGNLDRATGVAIQANGKIVVVGSVQRDSQGNFDFGVARLTTSGSLDTTFGSGGLKTIAFDKGGSRSDTASGVAIDSLGRIVVVGTAQIDGSGNTDFAVARLTSSGALDMGFYGGAGKRIIAFDKGGTSVSNGDRANAVAIDKSNRIVVAGAADNATDSDFAVARLNTNGYLDGGFNGTGKRTISFNFRNSSKFDEANSVAIDNSSGKIVLAGYAARNFSGDYDFALARLTSSGKLDNSFDGDGRPTVAFDLGGKKLDVANAVAIDSSGRIVVAGYASKDSSGNTDFAVARLTSSGALDTSFGNEGLATVAFDLGSQGNGVSIGAGGNIVVAGEVDSGGFGVIQLLGS